MTERVLGLDIGITSVGWAVVDYDKKDIKNNKIHKSGVRIFTIAENPKTGESLALPRKLARGARRTNKRRKQRLNELKILIFKKFNLTNEEIFNSSKITDVWQLRDKVIKRQLTNIELSRVLLHIAKRRGYKSNRRIDELKNNEGKKVLSAIDKNKKLLNGYLTIGQAIYNKTKNTKIRRNKKDNYNNSISRDMLLEEINTILIKQKEFGNINIDENFKENYIKLFQKQRELLSINEIVGTCTLEGKSYKRAPKRSLSSEEFITLTKLINTKLFTKDGFERSFNKDELRVLLALCKKSQNPSYLRIRNALDLDINLKFKALNYYHTDEKTGEALNPEMNKFKSAFVGFHQLKNVVEKKSLSKEHWENLSKNKELLNEIAKIFSYHKSDKKIENELKKLDFKTLTLKEKTILIEALINNISFDKFLYLSVKAIENLLPYMNEAKGYHEAVELLNYKKNDIVKNTFLRALNNDEMIELNNPVVKRALSQTRKIINALIREYGKFDKVHMVLTREITNSHIARKIIKKGQEEYKKRKEILINEFIEIYKKEPKGNELLKFRLLKEQNYICIYTGESIQINQLLEDGYLEIDHILPFSKSLEDGIQNKVLCFAEENVSKRNRTPYEYFMQEKKDWLKFETLVHKLNLKKVKIRRLLKRNFNENIQKEFQERNKNDSAYRSSFIKNFISDNLDLKTKDKKKVLNINESFISMLRHNWIKGNANRKNHLRYATDAIVVAFASNNEIDKLSNFLENNECNEKRINKLEDIYPLNNFKDEVQKSVNNIFVSFAPRKSIKGLAHEQTFYSPKDFKANKKQDNNSILAGGSVIRNVMLNNYTQIAKQSTMSRVDIFQHSGTNKYYVVPIYISDFVKDVLPNKAIVAGKDNNGFPKEWIEMENDFEFLFSIYKDELIEIKNNKEHFTGYFISSHSGTGALELKSHNNISDEIFKKKDSTTYKSVGIQNAIHIKKYQVDPLGNKFEIKKEKRIGTRRQNSM